MINYYDVLNIKPSATDKDIYGAYIKLIKQNHPDVNVNKEESTKKSQIINEAYHILKDSVKRKQYDNLLDLEKSKPTKDENINEGHEHKDIRCEKCKTKDSSLRFVIFSSVFSIIMYTQKSAHGYILC